MCCIYDPLIRPIFLSVFFQKVKSRSAPFLVKVVRFFRHFHASYELNVYLQTSDSRSIWRLNFLHISSIDSIVCNGKLHFVFVNCDCSYTDSCTSSFVFFLTNPCIIWECQNKIVISYFGIVLSLPIPKFAISSSVLPWSR